MKSRLSCAALAIGVAVLVAAIDPARADRKVALVVGNSAYRNVMHLPNPVRDATAIAEMFRGAGFDEVIVKQDVGNLEFKRALRRFEDAAVGADTAVIYFAGHGIELNGKNFVIPVDAKLASDRDANDEAIMLERLISSSAPASRLRLIILDACRDNPFVRKIRRRTAVRSLSSGLAGVEPARTATLIAYASRGGSTAADGDGPHSPFTQALLKHLAVPGLDLRLAFGRVRDEVMKLTNRRQEPYVYGSLGGANVALFPRTAAVPAPEPSPADTRSDYELVARIGSRRAWEVFLGNHATGFYADLARAEIAKLDGIAAPMKSNTKLAVLAPSSDESIGANESGTDTNIGTKAAVSSSECRREQELLERLKLLGSSARPRLLGLQRSLSCEHLRPALLAALDKPGTEQPPETRKAAVEPVGTGPASPELVKQVQKQLVRVKCLDGAADGILGPATQSAIKRYLSIRKSVSALNEAITSSLVERIAKEGGRVCAPGCEATKAVRCHPDGARSRIAAGRPAKEKRRHETRRERPPAILSARGAARKSTVTTSAMIGVGF